MQKYLRVLFFFGVLFVLGCAGAQSGSAKDGNLPAENCAEGLTNYELGTCLDSCQTGGSGESIDCRAFCCTGEMRSDPGTSQPI